MNHARAKITNEYRLTPRDCPKCGRFMDEEYLKKKLKEVQKSKSDKIKESLSERRALGQQVGRAKLNRHDVEIMRLRRSGLSIRKIAKVIGCSTSLVVDRIKPRTDSGGDE